MNAPILYIVIPCYNEETVLPVTHALFAGKLSALIQKGEISEKSRVLFVDDGSKDNTWAVISDLRAKNPQFEGLKLSRNQGHQNALLAGLMTAKNYADITVSIDCDGQDDVDAMDKMLEEYKDGAEIVYGVRAARDTDTVFKRTTAKWYYKILNLLGAEVVYNHADYRLMSRRALEALEQFHEVNLFLRGLIPLVGFKSSSVYYDRKERVAGKSHYPLSKMLSLGFNGVTSLSVRPLKLITGLGFFDVACQFDCRGGYGDYQIVRLHRAGLDKPFVRDFPARRYSDFLPRRHRRIHRQNVCRNQSAPTVYY